MSSTPKSGNAAASLKDLGWDLRRATAEDFTGGAPRSPEEIEEFWVQENLGAGLKTPPLPNPGAARLAAHKLQEGRDSGQLGDVGCDAAEAVADTPAEDEAHAELADAERPEGDGETADADQTLDTQVSEPPAPGAPPATGQLLFGDGLPSASYSLRRQVHSSRLTTHPSLMMRARGLDDEHVERLRAAIRRGETLEALDVFDDGATLLVADGNHRHKAAELEGGAILDINVRAGTLRDAIRHAVRANARHGKQRSHDDARLAVVTILLDEEWSRKSDNQIADMADVSQPFVGKVQGWLAALLPLLAADPDGELSDEELADQSDAPDGFVSIVRSLPGGADARASLSYNVIARAESRTSATGKRFIVERAAPDEPPPLLAGVEPAPEPAVEVEVPPIDPNAGWTICRCGVKYDVNIPEEVGAHAQHERAPFESTMPRAEEQSEQLTQFHRLTELLKARPEGVHTDELVAAGFSMHEIGEARRARVIERHENGKCYHAWKADDVVAALGEHGGRLSRRALEELGCQSYALTVAVGDPRITQPEAGIFALANTSSAESVSSQASASPAVPRPDAPKESATDVRRDVEQNRREPQHATVEEMLKGRKGLISFNWIPGVKGRVQVTVSVDGDVAGATRELVEERELRLSEKLLGMVERQSKAAGATQKAVPALPAAGATKTATRKSPAKSSSKKAATSSSKKAAPARASKSGAKGASKSAAKSASKSSKAGAKGGRRTRA
jgi:hypothetical protein